MKIEQAYINQIRQQFAELQSKEDLVKLLSEAKSLLYGEKCKPIQLKSLTYYANPKLCKQRYQTFTIKKKSGADRTINSPIKGLKSILRSLNFVLNCVYEPHEAATGFVNDKSIVDNAKKHVGQHYVLNIDLKDFFHSFDRKWVKYGFSYEPFNLSGSQEKEELAFLLASLCTHPFEIDGKEKTVLPQGSPTSPTLTNILCKKLDRRLTGLANRFGATYTRYADDITFSSQHNIYTDEAFNNELKRIIEEDQKLVINPKKTRLQKAGYRQEVTGLIVNDQVNVHRRYVKQIRMWLYYWEKYGYEKAEQIFKSDYLTDKGHVKKPNACLVNVLDGKLEFLKMVKGTDSKLYSKLKSRFHQLSTTNIKSKPISEADIVTKNDTKEVRITLEVHQFPERNDKLHNSIKIPRGTVLPTTIIVPNSILDVVRLTDESIYPIIHNPSTTVSLLKYFTANDKNLKYTTHSWEEGKYDSYEDFLSKISFEWNEIKEEIKKQSIRLHAKISNFLFNNTLGKKNEKGFYEVWGESRLKFGWSSEELSIHMSEPGNSPFSCSIPEPIKQLDKKYNLHYFKDYAEVFKNEIEFREDSNNFKKMILDIWENELGYDYQLNGLDQLVGFSLFTDVALVKASVVKIFEMFKGKPHYPVISIEKITSFENRGYHLFKITQIDSFVTRSIDDPKFRNPTGSLNTIIEQLKNLCDYSIVSRFQDGNTYRINYLSSSNTSEFIKKLPDNETALGITHELKFYL